MQVDWHTFLEQQGGQIHNQEVRDFGDMWAELGYVQADETIISDLSNRGLLLATGSEVLSFLQGQLTNDVMPAAEGYPILAAHLNPKGRVLANLLIFPFEEGYALDFPGSMVASLQKRLTMFVLRADVRIHNACDTWIRLGVTGRFAAHAAAASIGAEIVDDHQVTKGESGTSVPLPGPIPAFLILGPQTASPEIWSRALATAHPVGDPAWRLARIRAGVPEIGAANSEAFIPQEANLEPLSGISYTKGCYTGQEVVARTKHLGRLKRRTYRIHSSGPLSPGQLLYAASEDQSQGRIIEAAPAPEGGFEALAVIRIETAEARSPLFPEGQPELTVQLLDLPYSIVTQ